MVLLPVGAARSDPVPAGEVSGTWTLSGSPYLVEGEIEVPLGQTLVIEPGVEVRFLDHYSLTVRGCLMAVGTAADTILFHAAQPSTGWHSLRFLDTYTYAQPASEVRYCRIQDGKASGSCPDNSGGAIYLGHATAVIANCLIRGNEATYGAGSWGGGAIACDYSTQVTIERNTIADNYSGHDGGGIYCYWAAPDIYDNVFTGNSAVRGAAIACFVNSAADIRGNVFDGNDGEALYLSGAAAWVVNNRFAGNTRAIHTYLYAPKIIGNLIVGHATSTGAGIWLEGSSPQITNNTIADNLATSQGGGIYASQVVSGATFPSNPVLVDNLLWGNVAPTGPQYSGGTGCSATLSYSDVEDLAGAGLAGTVVLGDGNLDAPPEWTGSGDDPYAVCLTSPCRNAGAIDASGLNLPAVDLAGNVRVLEDRVDVGAYECPAGVGVPGDVPAPLARLLPCHPNPFNPRTTLGFWLDAAQPVRLDVLDLAGRRVATIWDGPAPAGVTEVGWSGVDAGGRALPSGAYLGRLRTATGTVATTRLMLVR